MAGRGKYVYQIGLDTSEALAGIANLSRAAGAAVKQLQAMEKQGAASTPAGRQKIVAQSAVANTAINKALAGTNDPELRRELIAAQRAINKARRDLVAQLPAQEAAELKRTFRDLSRGVRRSIEKILNQGGDVAKAMDRLADELAKQAVQVRVSGAEAERIEAEARSAGKKKAEAQKKAADAAEKSARADAKANDRKRAANDRAAKANEEEARAAEQNAKKEKAATREPAPSKPAPRAKKSAYTPEDEKRLERQIKEKTTLPAGTIAPPVASALRKGGVGGAFTEEEEAFLRSRKQWTEANKTLTQVNRELDKLLASEATTVAAAERTSATKAAAAADDTQAKKEAGKSKAARQKETKAAQASADAAVAKATEDARRARRVPLAVPVDGGGFGLGGPGLDPSQSLAREIRENSREYLSQRTLQTTGRLYGENKLRATQILAQLIVENEKLVDITRAEAREAARAAAQQRVRSREIQKSDPTSIQALQERDKAAQLAVEAKRGLVATSPFTRASAGRYLFQQGDAVRYPGAGLTDDFRRDDPTFGRGRRIPKVPLVPPSLGVLQRNPAFVELFEVLSGAQTIGGKSFNPAKALDDVIEDSIPDDTTRTRGRLLANIEKIRIAGEQRRERARERAELRARDEEAQAAKPTPARRVEEPKPARVTATQRRAAELEGLAGKLYQTPELEAFRSELRGIARGEIPTTAKAFKSVETRFKGLSQQAEEAGAQFRSVVNRFATGELDADFVGPFAGPLENEARQQYVRTQTTDARREALNRQYDEEIRQREEADRARKEAARRQIRTDEEIAADKKRLAQRAGLTVEQYETLDPLGRRDLAPPAAAPFADPLRQRFRRLAADNPAILAEALRSAQLPFIAGDAGLALGSREERLTFAKGVDDRSGDTRVKSLTAQQVRLLEQAVRAAEREVAATTLTSDQRNKLARLTQRRLEAERIRLIVIEEEFYDSLPEGPARGQAVRDRVAAAREEERLSKVRPGFIKDTYATSGNLQELYDQQRAFFVRQGDLDSRFGYSGTIGMAPAGMKPFLEARDDGSYRMPEFSELSEKQQVQFEEMVYNIARKRVDAESAALTEAERDVAISRAINGVSAEQLAAEKLTLEEQERAHADLVKRNASLTAARARAAGEAVVPGSGTGGVATGGTPYMPPLTSTVYTGEIRKLIDSRQGYAVTPGDVEYEGRLAREIRALEQEIARIDAIPKGDLTEKEFTRREKAAKKLDLFSRIEADASAGDEIAQLERYLIENEKLTKGKGRLNEQEARVLRQRIAVLREEQAAKAYADETGRRVDRGRARTISPSEYPLRPGEASLGTVRWGPEVRTGQVGEPIATRFDAEGKIDPQKDDLDPARAGDYKRSQQAVAEANKKEAAVSTEAAVATQESVKATRAEVKATAAETDATLGATTAQEAKAAAAANVAQELGFEAVSAQIATDAQQLKATAAEKVAKADDKLRDKIKKLTNIYDGIITKQLGGKPDLDPGVEGKLFGPDGQEIIGRKKKDKGGRYLDPEKEGKRLADSDIAGRREKSARDRVIAASDEAAEQIMQNAARDAEIRALKEREASAVGRQAALQSFRTETLENIAAIEADIAARKLQDKNITQAALNANSKYVTEAAKSVRLEQEANNVKQAALNADKQYFALVAEGAVLQAEANALEAGQLAENAALLVATSEAAAAELKLKTLTEAEVSTKQLLLLQENEQVKDALKRNEANKAKIAAINAEAQLAAAALVAQETSTNQTLQKVAAEHSINKLKQQERVAMLRRQAEDKEFIRLKAEENVLQRVLNKQLRTETRRQLRSAGGLSLFERLGLAGTGGTGGHGGGGGSFGGTLGSTLRYGASSFLLFGALGGMTMAVKEAQELEKLFNQIEAQTISMVEDMGGTADDAQQEMSGIRSSILGIAEATGIASTEVANVFYQFQGAFGGDTQKALFETNNAIRAVKVTGLSLKETIDAFTAITQSFKGANISIVEVSDSALGLQDRFGVLAKETISFAADLAPVAEQAGFTVEQLEALGAVSQKYSGRSGSSLAEAFGRIIPQVQENALTFINLFDQIRNEVPEVNEIFPDIQDAFASGDIQKFIEILIPVYNKLGEAQQNFIIDTLGGRREAAALVGVLNNGSDLLAEWSGQYDDAGKTADRFAKLQETLAQKVSILGEKLRQLGVEIFEAGLGDALKLIVDLVSQFSGILEVAFRTVGGITGLMDGLPAKILAIIAVSKVLARVWGSIEPRGVRTSVSDSFRSGGLSYLGQPTFNWERDERKRSGRRFVRPFYLDETGQRQVPFQNVLAGAAGSTRQIFGRSGLSAGGRLSLAGSQLRQVGAGAFSAIGGFAGLATIGGMIALQYLQGAQEKREERYREEARGTIDGLKARIETQAREGGTRAFETTAFAELVDIATGNKARRSRGGAFGDVNGFGEYATERLLGDAGAGYASVIRAVTGGEAFRDAERDRFYISAKEKEEIIAARQAIIELEGENFVSVMSSLRTASLEAFDNDSLFLDLADSVVINPDDVSDRTKRFIDSYGSKTATDGGFRFSTSNRGFTVQALLEDGLDPSKATGEFTTPGGESIKYTSSDISTLVFKTQAGLDLTEQESKLFVASLQRLSDIASGKRTNVPEELKEVAKAFQGQRDFTEGMQQIIADSDTALQLFQLGALTRFELLQQLESQYSNALSLLKSVPTDKNAQAQVLKLREQLQQQAGEQVRGDADFALKMAELSGKDSPAFSIDILKAVAGNADISPEERLKAADDIIAAIQVQRQTELDAASSIEDTGARLQAELAILSTPLAIPAEAQAAYIEQQLSLYNSSFQELIASLQLSSITVGEVTRLVAQRMAETGETVEIATKQIIEGQISILEQRQGELRRLKRALEKGGGDNGGELEKIEDEIRQNQEDLDELYGSRARDFDIADPNIPKTTTATGAEIAAKKREIEQQKKEDEQKQDDIVKARFELLRAQADRNEALIIDIDRQEALYDYQRAAAEGDVAAMLSAQAKLVQVDQRARDFQKSVSDAQRGVVRAQVGSNAVLLAQLDQQQADADYAIAIASGDTVGALNAQAARIEADRRVRDAILALQSAQLGVLLAQANALDDTVKAAEIGLQQAEIALQQAQNGGDPAAIEQARAQVVAAQDSIHDAALQEQIDAQQFLYDMGRISRQQFVAYLQGLLVMAGNSEKDIRNIQRMIKQLQSESQQDLQYNLPTTLGLPTLYEARRLNQSTAIGQQIGYQDNRTQTVQVYVTNGMTEEQATSLIRDALASDRSGVRPRRY